MPNKESRRRGWRYSGDLLGAIGLNWCLFAHLILIKTGRSFRPCATRLNADARIDVATPCLNFPTTLYG